MRTISKIACRTTGIAGMGIALYNATQVSKLFSKNEAQLQQAKYLDSVYFSSRTIDSVNYVDNSLREKTFDLRARNPIPALWGKTKGCFLGFMYGLGNSLPFIVSGAMAILCKGIGAKIGAAGVVATLAYSVLKNGFGIGKEHPMH